MNRNAIAVLAFAALLVISSGCISSLLNSSTGKYLQDSGTVVNVQMTVDQQKLSDAVNGGNCTILVCQNSTKATSSFWKFIEYTYYSARFWKWMDPSLIGGNCTLQNITLSNNNDTLEGWANGSFYLREFGIGQGMSFADFNDANAYCNGSLRYSLKAVRSLDGATYMFSPKSYAGAACFLDKSVVPIYIMYNNGTIPAGDNSANFAAQMAGLGPVMIATEMNPLDNDDNIANLATQIMGMKTSCPNCLIGLSVTELNYSDMMKKLDGYGALSYVDFVGFGLDSDYLPSQYQCGNGADMVSAAEAATTGIVTAYHKPVFWYYVNINRTACKWSDFNEREMLSLMFNDLAHNAKSGLMGMAPGPFHKESFFSDSPDTAFLNDTNPNSPSLRQSASSTWFSLCRNYYNNQNFQVFAMDTSPFLTKCGGALNNVPEKTMTFEGQVSGQGDFPPLAEVDYADKSDDTYRCQSCLLIYDSTNSPSFIKNAKGSFSSVKCSSPADAVAAMEFYGELYDIDSNLLKAIADKESGFNHCAVSNLTSASARLCTGIVLKPSDVSAAMQAAGCDPASIRMGDADTICALGIMQTTDLPGDMYSNPSYGNLPMPDWVKACGGKDFNPFNASHSICAASYRIARSYMPQAATALSSNQDIFTVTSNDQTQANEDTDTLRDALLVAFTSELYYGNGVSSGTDMFIPLWSSFKSNLDKGTDCGKMNSIGNSLCCSNGKFKNQYGVCNSPSLDAVTFYAKVKSAYPKIQYGMDVLGRYLAAAQTCGGCTKDSWYKAMCAKIHLYAPNAQCG